MERCVNALKEWTGKAKATIIYDSTVDEFTHDGLFTKVRGKPNIAVVGFTTDGDMFGGFYSVAVTKQKMFFHDLNIFVFSFESHGRCETPQRFVEKKELRLNGGSVSFWDKDFERGFVFIWARYSRLFLGNERSDSFCFHMSDAFEGLEDTTLTGKTSSSDQGPNHHCTRLVAIQLE